MRNAREKDHPLEGCQWRSIIRFVFIRILFCVHFLWENFIKLRITVRFRMDISWLA